MVNPTAPVQDDDAELERWSDIQDDTDAIVTCGERWKRVAAKVGCQLHGFNDGRSASFFTPDGNVIEVGPKFRKILSHLSPTPETGLVEALELAHDVAHIVLENATAAADAEKAVALLDALSNVLSDEV